MAGRTIAAGGGNFSSTATWVGGVIPTSSDHIIGDATSGQLTLDGNYQVQYVDFTNYTQTLTLNATRTLTLSLASSTNTFDSGMSFAGTGTITFGSVSSTIVQNTTSRIPNVICNGSVVRTLSTDMYVGNLTINNSPSLNGNTIYISGNFVSAFNSGNDYGGTTNFYLDGTGLISANIRSKITIVGDYNTYLANLYLCNGGEVEYLTGATPTLFNIILNKRNTQNDTYTLNINKPTNVNLFIYNRARGTTGDDMFINLNGNSYVDLLGCYTMFNIGTTEDAITTYTFSGASFSANTISMEPFFRNTSVATDPPASNAFIYQAPKLKFDENYTHYFGKMFMNGGITQNSTFTSITGGVQVPINLGSKITSQIANYDFTDVDASGGDEIVAINGTLSNTSNITNVYPSGGGGGGQTAYTFFS